MLPLLSARLQMYSRACDSRGRLGMSNPKTEPAEKATEALSEAVTEREIWTIAGLMVEEFGSEAVLEASMRADKAMGESDLVNQRLWTRVVRAITELTDTDAGTVH